MSTGIGLYQQLKHPSLPYSSLSYDSIRTFFDDLFADPMENLLAKLKQEILDAYGIKFLDDNEDALIEYQIRASELEVPTPAWGGRHYGNYDGHRSGGDYDIDKAVL